MMSRNTFLLFILTTFLSSCKSQYVPKVDILQGFANRTSASMQVHSGIQKLIYYDLDDAIDDPGHVNIRIMVSVDTYPGHFPVLFSVREPNAVLSWQLPITQIDQNQQLITYYTMERTLCAEFAADNSQQKLQIEISTYSEDPISFSVSVNVFQDIVLRVEEPPRKFSVSPVSPAFYRYDPMEGSESLLIKVTASEDNPTCVIFSIQHPSCPIFDQDENVQFQGYWQTMTSLGSILVRQHQFPAGFFVVFVALSDDKRCSRVSGINQLTEYQTSQLGKEIKTKELFLTLENVIEPADYVTPVFVPLAFIIGLTVIIFIVFSIFQNLLKRRKADNEIAEAPLPRSKFEMFQSCLSLQEIKEDRTFGFYKKSKRYFWTILTIGIFYCVPVVQLIANYLRVLYRTGEYDLCYYNYQCARPLGYLVDFNHIYSNIGYVIFGIVFISFVYFRRRSLYAKEYSCRINSDDDLGDRNQTLRNQGLVRRILPRIFGRSVVNDYGTFQSLGIYYALGVALILEGVLSAAYHICPNQSNFQFDTSFMYVIAVLGIVKIYQFRHPPYLNANITFIGLAFVAASSVFGLLFNNLIFKVCFSIVYFLGLVSLLIYVYHVGFATDKDGVLLTGWADIYKGVFKITVNYEKSPVAQHSKKARLIFPVSALIINISIIIFLWTLLRHSNFATQLLAIFVANFSAYTFYYVIMKFLHGEYKRKLWIQMVIYGTLSLVLWVIALYYFRQALSSWEESPAESRTLNEDCIVFSFYDNHDLWHFASSGALLTSFMLLLTIDDDLITTKHDNIPVF